MVVDALASDSGVNLLSVLCLMCGGCVPELIPLLLQPHSDLIGLVMFDGSVLNTLHLVLVLLWQNLPVFDWLHRGVVMILVRLLVDSGLNVFMVVRLDVFIDDWCVGGFIDFLHFISIVYPLLGSLGSIRCDECQLC